MKTRSVQEAPGGHTFWTGPTPPSAAHSWDRDAAKDPNADTLCASRRDGEERERVGGGINFWKLHLQ